MANPELRCSVQTRAAEVDPIGTATTTAAYLLVEVPLPWPPAILDHPLLVAVGAALEHADVAATVLGIVPDHDETDRHRVIAHRRPPGPFRRYRRTERVVAGADLAAAAVDLLTAPVAGSVDAAADGQALTPHEDDGTTDLLICTHGRRDRCCGSFGMNLFTAVGARHVRAGVRSWRVSHTGGHRFAPTALVLPEGHLWSWLDGDLVDAVVHRRGDVADVLDHYRGSSAIGSAPVQVAEREAFRREGWGWLDGHRSGAVVAGDDRRAEVRLDVHRADGTVGAYAATVERVGTVPQPMCGELPGGAGNGKSDSIWVLTRFDAVAPAPPG